MGDKEKQVAIEAAQARVNAIYKQIIKTTKSITASKKRLKELEAEHAEASHAMFQEMFQAQGAQSSENHHEQ